MKKLKVMTIVGTRPEIIRLSATINRLEKSEAIDHILVHTGQNYDYELNEVFFEDFNLRKPDFFLNAANGTATETIGHILIAVDPILEQVKPEAILILGDTNSCLCAIAAKKRKIPIFHMEAGNRCFDQRVPEETNRKIVDHIADINLTYSSIAREYLLREGLSADRIIKTGSPMYEVLQSKRSEIENSDVLSRLGLEKERYFLVSAHREENIGSEKNFLNLVKSLNTIAENYNLPVILSTHPRTKNMISKKKIQFHKNIITLKPLGFIDYNNLQINAKAVLSDSGTISEETSILGLRSLNIREAHERPEAMEESTTMMVGLEIDRILQGLKELEDNVNMPKSIVEDYNVNNVSWKVLRILISYTDYVKRNVWREIN
ncbi:non-hydrolyzing UDP-N-acetylglucosamine 2-epimerase [Exiguobacterium aurantiacum]|uniref:non-hydrolyzing UDP-N-acetylglucosamine 2-epimerase n=1 Tax=Exiguobacterium aurantiacum TaxID=33987 RepID=UPI0008779355|nr:UDP-N-acetylglucosamine 2-epimerase (non-hydrolyzing) [Exiguobacterium aurantiacum]